MWKALSTVRTSIESQTNSGDCESSGTSSSVSSPDWLDPAGGPADLAAAPRALRSRSVLPCSPAEPAGMSADSLVESIMMSTFWSLSRVDVMPAAFAHENQSKSVKKQENARQAGTFIGIHCHARGQCDRSYREPRSRLGQHSPLEWRL